jgi:hypothetical protein
MTVRRRSPKLGTAFQLQIPGKESAEHGGPFNSGTIAPFIQSDFMTEECFVRCWDAQQAALVPDNGKPIFFSHNAAMALHTVYFQPRNQPRCSRLGPFNELEVLLLRGGVSLDALRIIPQPQSWSISAHVLFMKLTTTMRCMRRGPCMQGAFSPRARMGSAIGRTEL